MNEIFEHTCEDMSELATGSVDLTVTSPPYWNAIDYDVHTADKSANYRPRQSAGYGEYLAFLLRCFTETLRVHKPGSHCAVVIGTVLLNGDHKPVPFHFLALMEEIGWQFHQDIIWSKCTGGVKRAGSTIQNPYPGYYYPNIMTEYILVFRKPGERRIYQNRKQAEKERDAIELDSVFTKDIANNIWHIAPVPPNQIDHPCPFPEEIPYRLIRLFSYTDDLVLDPFAGVGTTLKVAQATGRRWVGFEINAHYAELARQRVREPLRLRKQLLCNYEKVEYGVRLPSTNPRRAPFRRVKPAPALSLFAETNGKGRMR